MVSDIFGTGVLGHFESPAVSRGRATGVKILRRVSQDKRIIEHNRTKLYTLQQDHKQVSRQGQNVFSAWLTEPHSQ